MLCNVLVTRAKQDAWISSKPSQQGSPITTRISGKLDLLLIVEKVS